MRNPRAEEKLAAVRATATPYQIVRAGIALTVTANVYPTSELSELFVELMDDPDLGLRPDQLALDYGTGTGFLAVAAARRGAQVTALDINPDAIACAMLNAQRYAVDRRISLRCGPDLSQIGADERFDHIYAGMPWDDGVANDMLERSVYDDGFVMRRALFDRAGQLLRPGGHLYFSSVEGHRERYPELYRHHGLRFTPVRRRSIKGLDHLLVQGTAIR